MGNVEMMSGTYWHCVISVAFFIHTDTVVYLFFPQAVLYMPLEIQNLVLYLPGFKVIVSLLV